MREPAVLHMDSSSGWGGGQNQVRLLMRELARQNIKQLCICPTGSPLAQRLTTEGLPVKTIRWRGGADPRAIWQVLRTLGAFNIAHAHDAHALQIAILPARLRSVRLIGARRVPFTTSAAKWNRADRVIAVSQTVREKLLASGVHEQRIRVIHSGTDLQETRAVQPLEPRMRAQRGVPEDAFVVVNAAYFVKWKGQLVIPPTAALLPDVHWFVAGEGPMREELEASIEQYDVADRVHLLGWLPDARPLLREADVYVSASTEDGLGNSVTESLALQVPVVSADAGGGAEIMRPVQERTGAVLFEPGNAESLAAAITKLRAADVRRQVIAAQDERFRDFAIERTAAQTLAIYRELLA